MYCKNKSREGVGEVLGVEGDGSRERTLGLKRKFTGFWRSVGELGSSFYLGRVS
jgi:hypothetical protein